MATALSVAGTLTAGVKPASTSDTCGLVTAAEIEASIKLTSQGHKATSGEECIWDVGPVGDYKTVTVALLSKQLFESLRITQTMAVAGIGDEAYWSDGLSTLNVRKGDNALQVQIATLQSSDESLAAAKSLATKALERLK